MDNKYYNLSFIDIIKIIYKKKIFIILGSIIGIVISFYFAVNRNPIFESYIVIKEIGSSNNNKNELQSIKNILFMGENNNKNELHEIVKSRSFNEKIVKYNNLFNENVIKKEISYEEKIKNHVKKYLGIKNYIIKNTISNYSTEFINGNLEIIENGKYLKIKISWEDPIKAKDIANSYAVVLRKHLKEEQELNIKYQLEGLNKIINKFKKEIDSNLIELNNYINKNKTINPTIEIEEVNKLIARFKIQIIENRLEMASLNSKSIKYIYLKDKNKLLSHEVKNLISPKGKSKSNLYPISYKDYVSMNFNFEKINRELGISSDIYKNLRSSIESLKINLISDNLFFSIVDPAIPSYISKNGSRSSIMLKGILISIISSVLLVLGFHLLIFYKSEL